MGKWAWCFQLHAPRAAGPGLDPEWGVDAPRQPGQCQLLVGGGATAAGAWAVPAGHRGNAPPPPNRGMAGLMASACGTGTRGGGRQRRACFCLVPFINLLVSSPAIRRWAHGWPWAGVFRVSPVKHESLIWPYYSLHSGEPHRPCALSGNHRFSGIHLDTYRLHKGIIFIKLYWFGMQDVARVGDLMVASFLMEG